MYTQATLRSLFDAFEQAHIEQGALYAEIRYTMLITQYHKVFDCQTMTQSGHRLSGWQGKTPWSRSVSGLDLTPFLSPFELSMSREQPELFEATLKHHSPFSQIPQRKQSLEQFFRQSPHVRSNKNKLTYQEDYVCYFSSKKPHQLRTSMERNCIMRVEDAQARTPVQSWVGFNIQSVLKQAQKDHHFSSPNPPPASPMPLHHDQVHADHWVWSSKAVATMTKELLLKLQAESPPVSPSDSLFFAAGPPPFEVWERGDETQMAVDQEGNPKTDLCLTSPPLDFGANCSDFSMTSCTARRASFLFPTITLFRHIEVAGIKNKSTPPPCPPPYVLLDQIEVLPVQPHPGELHLKCWGTYISQQGTQVLMPFVKKLSWSSLFRHWRPMDHPAETHGLVLEVGSQTFISQVSTSPLVSPAY